MAVKVKFWKSGEFVVDHAPNAKQSVRLIAFDGRKRVCVGNCTVPEKYMNVIQRNAVVSVKYLYATPGGQLYQASLDPDDNGQVVRDDKAQRECGIDQLQFEGQDDA